MTSELILSLVCCEVSLLSRGFSYSARYSSISVRYKYCVEMHCPHVVQ